jgi:hypothetical protein
MMMRLSVADFTRNAICAGKFDRTVVEMTSALGF